MSENSENSTKEFVWKFEDKQYDLFLVNGTGGIGMPILDPVKQETVVGMIGARFTWESNEPFLEHLDVESIDKAQSNDDWNKRENDSLIKKNAELFQELVVDGYSVDIDEFGNRQPQNNKSREQMLSYRKPVQSDLITAWLKSQVHIERWIPKEMSSVDAFLADVSELHFTLKIGDYNNPRHLVFFTFDAPNDDAITAYQNDTFERGQNQNQDWRFRRDNQKRLNFAKKYLRNVEGIVLGPVNNLEPRGDELYEFDINNSDHAKHFKKLFNGEWMCALADEIAAAFNLGKK